MSERRKEEEDEKDEEDAEDEEEEEDEEVEEKGQEAKRRMEQQMQYSPARGPKPTSSGANIPPSMLAQEPTSAAANEDGTEVLSNLNHLSSYLKGES